MLDEKTERYTAVLASCGEKFFTVLSFPETSLDDAIGMARSVVASMLRGNDDLALVGTGYDSEEPFPMESKMEDWTFYATDDTRGRSARCAWSEIQEAADTQVEMAGPSGGPTPLSRIRKS